LLYLLPCQSQGFLLELYIMTTFTINTKAINAVFTDADNKSANFTERLLKLGIASRAMAKPFAMKWAAGKYGVAIEQGTRGDKLPRDSAAEKAMNRVLQVCFPSADLPSKAATVNKADPVAALVKKFGTLSKAEQRRFLASI
jgi:hypothetical protein